MLGLLAMVADTHAQWPPVPEIAGRGGAAGAAAGILSPLRPAHLPVYGTWHVRLHHYVPFGVITASGIGARLGRTDGRSTWLASAKATRFDAYQAVFMALSYMYPVSSVQGLRLGASLGGNHERMGLLGARLTPFSAVGLNWHPLARTFFAVHLLNSRSMRLHAWVAAFDATFHPGRRWPRLHATVALHPESGLSLHVGSTWTAMERMGIDIGSAANPFRTAASVQVRTGALVVRFAFVWQPDLGTSRWTSVGWS